MVENTLRQVKSAEKVFDGLHRELSTAFLAIFTMCLFGALASAGFGGGMGATASFLSPSTLWNYSVFWGGRL